MCEFCLLWTPLAFYFHLSYGTYHFLPCITIICMQVFSLSYIIIRSQNSFCSPQHLVHCLAHSRHSLVLIIWKNPNNDKVRKTLMFKNYFYKKYLNWASLEHLASSASSLQGKPPSPMFTCTCSHTGTQTQTGPAALNHFCFSAIFYVQVSFIFQSVTPSCCLTFLLTAKLTPTSSLELMILPSGSLF